MPPSIIRNDRGSAGTVVFRMQSIQWIEAAFKALHFFGLTHHGVQHSAHQVDDALFKLPATLRAALLAPVGNRQTPDALD